MSYFDNYSRSNGDPLGTEQRWFPFVAAVPAIAAVVSTTDQGITGAALFGLGLGVIGVMGAALVWRQGGNPTGFMLGAAIGLGTFGLVLGLMAIAPVPGPGEDF